MDTFSKIDSRQARRSTREVDTIRNVADELKSELLTALRRLDVILNG